MTRAVAIAPPVVAESAGITAVGTEIEETVEEDLISEVVLADRSGGFKHLGQHLRIIDSQDLQALFGSGRAAVQDPIQKPAKSIGCQGRRLPGH